MIPSIITDNIEIDIQTGCWVWTAGSSGGYALAYIEGKTVRAARWLYCYLHKKKPPVVMHLCNNKLCVNPKHLKGGTHSENRQHYWDNDTLRLQRQETVKRIEILKKALRQI